MSATTYATLDAEDEDSIFRTSAHALSDAAVDARAQAKVAAQNVKDSVGWGIYKAAFGLSFGVVFTGVFLTELLPVQSSLRRGLEDGASGALEAIEVRKAPHVEVAEAPVAPQETVLQEALPASRSAATKLAERGAVATRGPRKRSRP